MKKTLLFMVAGAAILFTACNKELEVNNPEENQENGPVYITANIDSETKATLANDGGAFAFSSDDAIKVCNESGAYSGTNTSDAGNSGTFAMDAGFDGSTDGIAGFPASSVYAMTTGSVTFNLPTTYEYSEVGGTDPGDAKVPCPMIGYYNASKKNVTFKQAGAVVRFRVTNLAAGSLSITFSSLVTGRVTLSSVSTADDGGILAANIESGTYYGRGNTITINGVPDVTSPSYIYITLPVPTSTAPEDIYLSNTPSNGALNPRMQALAGSEDGLKRAGGYKITANMIEIPSPTFKVADLGEGKYRKVVIAPGNLMAKIGTFVSVDATGVTTTTTGAQKAASYATADEWKFGDYLQYIGGDPTQGNYLLSTHQATCVGTWVDLFRWQGASASRKLHGLFTASHSSYYPGVSKYDDASSDLKAFYDSRNSEFYGTSATEALYSGCWNTDKDTYPDDAITISNGGSYKWRLLTHDEWVYLLNTRPTQTLNAVPNARYAPVKIEGINGLLIFPDNVSAVWNDATKGTLGNYPVKESINGSSCTWASASSYTHANLVALAGAGFVFLPAAGFSYGSGGNSPVNCDNTFGYYWSSTGAAKVSASTTTNGAVSAYYFEFKNTSIDLDAIYLRSCGRSVRLVREVE